MDNEQILIDRELLQDLVHAAKWVAGMFEEIKALGGEEQSEDWNATEYLASEAAMIHTKGQKLLEKHPRKANPDELPF